MKKIALILMVSVLVLTGCGSKNTTRIPEEKIKSNTNEEVIQTKEVDGLKIEKASLVYEGGRTTLTTSVTNVTKEVIKVDYIKIKYTDDNGKETVLLGEIGDTLKPNEVVRITSRTDVDLTKAVKVEYEVVKQKTIENQ